MQSNHESREPQRDFGYFLLNHDKYGKITQNLRCIVNKRHQSDIDQNFFKQFFLVYSTFLDLAVCRVDPRSRRHRTGARGLECIWRVWSFGSFWGLRGLGSGRRGVDGGLGQNRQLSGLRAQGLPLLLRGARHIEGLSERRVFKGHERELCMWNVE